MADFGYSPDFNYRVESNFNVIRSRFENQSEQRRLKSAQKLRKFSLNFRNRSSSEFSAVVSFFEAKYGSLTEFTVDINGEEVTGIFVERSFSWSRNSPNSYSYSFEFEEVVST